MALQGKFARFCNVLGNYNKTLLGNTYRNNFPSLQQIVVRNKSIEEKLNLPPRPKRPLTPYFRFMAQVRPEILQAKPGINAIDIVKELAARWEKIEPQYKSNLEAEFRRDQEVYAKQRFDYDTKLTDEQKELLKQARLDIAEDREKRKHRKKCRENEKPKKPCSSFVLFMKTKLPTRGNLEFKEFQKKISKEWFNLTDSEKEPFVDQMHKETKEYLKQMVEWERKMIKLGNTDIVRQNALLEPRPIKKKRIVKQKLDNTEIDSPEPKQKTAGRKKE